MLIEFSVENFRSIHARVTLSMLAATELDEKDDLVENTFDAPGGLRLLKTVLVYGANASGKSNLVKALNFARKFILESAKESQSGEAIDITPFRLDPDAEHRGSEFEFVWIDGRDRYRYRIIVTVERIVEEALFRSPADEGAEAELFYRDINGIRVGKEFSEGLGVESKTRENALFLSATAAWNGEVSQRILKWFRRDLVVVSGLQDRQLLMYTANEIRTGSSTDELVRLIREADLGITSISAPDVKVTEDMLPADIPDEAKQKLLSREYVTLRIRHQQYTSQGKPAGEIEFELSDESEGTNKFVALAAPLLDILKNGRSIIIDEFDARLHPRLTQAIVEAFHSDSNTQHAQLIAVTHDTNLLNRNLVRRDQVWFTEKDRCGATKLYSLAEFDLPPDAHYQRDYLLGHYGAIPGIGNLVAIAAGGDVQ